MGSRQGWGAALQSGASGFAQAYLMGEMLKRKPEAKSATKVDNDQEEMDKKIKDSTMQTTSIEITPDETSVLKDKELALKNKEIELKKKEDDLFQKIIDSAFGYNQNKDKESNIQMDYIKSMRGR